MRYNGNELKQMALNSQQVCTKEGVLSLREREGKLWNKTDTMTERWCRLVDNMFFYFKTKDVNSDPHGVFILEGSHVRKAENDQSNGCGFVLEFDGDNRSTYFLARKASDAKEWIDVLENASYAKLKLKYEMLQRQQRESKGEENVSSPLNSLAESRSANSSPLILSRKKIAPKDYHMTLSDVENSTETKSTKKAKSKRKLPVILPPDSVLPVIQLCLSCASLNISKTIDHKRNIFIQVQSSFPPEPNWTPIFRTEYIKAASFVQFQCTCSFFHQHLITPQTLLRFHLCQVKENYAIDTLGFASCSISDLLYLDCPVHFNILNHDSLIGKLGIDVCSEHITAKIVKSSKEEKLSAAVMATDNSYAKGLKHKLDQKYGEISQILNLKSLFSDAISRTYRFPTASGNYLSVQEIMLETKLSFHIPLLYLKLLIDQESKYIGALNSITSLPQKLKDVRTKQIEARTDLIEQYQHNVKSIVNHSRCGPNFKPSMQKAEKDLEFIPTNLHLQRMRVQHSDFMSALSIDDEDKGEANDANPVLMAVYNIITVGAAAAHCLKFKQGGLLSLISSGDKSKKGKEHVLSSLAGKESETNTMELIASMQEMFSNVQSLIHTILTLVSASKECGTAPNGSSAENALSELSNKVCALVSILDDRKLCQMITKTNVNMEGNDSALTALGNTISVLLSGSGHEWEEKKIMVKTSLALLVKNFHIMLECGEKNSLLELEETAPPPYDQVLANTKELSAHVSVVVDIAMQGYAMYSMQKTNEDMSVLFRRDVVFTQALSSCICGVITALCSSIKQKSFLNDVASHGMLVEFESLLSTYGNEMGMLEDYIVGVLDLLKVKFCCERATDVNTDSLAHLLPTLHGTRNNITVRLHLHPQCFDQLPEELRKGKAFKVIPVMFNIGINEEQTLAEKFGKTSLQEYINMDSYSRLLQYTTALKVTSGEKLAKAKYSKLDDRLSALGMAVHAKKSKNVEVLHLASEICHILNGVRVTSCKSAKDRTAMSVTLEQVQNLVRSHELSLSMFQSALSCMRSEGTRRENTKKNVGVRKYAFTSVQLMTFPKQYRPPDGTYGKGDS